MSIRRRPGPAPVAALLGSAQVSLAAVMLAAEYDTVAGSGPAVAVDVAAGVLGLVLLVLWRNAPVRLALVLAALLPVSAAATPAAGTAALWAAQRRRLPVAAGVAAAGVAGHLARGLWRPEDGRPFGLWLLVVAASYAALVGWGAQRRARGALLESLRDRARRAEEEQAHRVAEARRGERTRIAREMHDVLAHRLSLLAAYAGALEFRPDAPREELARAGGVIRAGAHEALEELREVIGVLRDEPAGPERDRPQPTLRDLPRLLAEARSAGSPVRLDDRLGPARVPDALGRTVYRVVQEGLTNGRRHAAGQPVTVVLAGRPGRGLVVAVANRTGPAGPAPGDLAAASAPGGGVGLVGLRERVELAGGRFGVRSGRGRFRIWAVLPWPA